MAAEQSDADDAQHPTTADIACVRERISEGAVLTNEPTTTPDSSEREYRHITTVQRGAFRTPERRTDLLIYETLSGDTVATSDDAEVAFLLANGWTLSNGGEN